MKGKRYLITGGAGFIGCNYAEHLLSKGKRVTILDNLSRRGAERNLAWLRKRHGENSFELIVADVRQPESFESVVRGKDVIVHLAAQVAVTSSVTDPRNDFEINAFGTFNLLEAVRKAGHKPFVIYASTNKVYGEASEHRLVKQKTRYRYAKLPLGVSETQPLDFHSPYGCSKGAAEQYVRDYSRIYGIPGVVMRQSCIYGPRQFGIEDQGWLAWFIIAALCEKPITIYGDGRQVRDMLHVRDLIAAYDAAVSNQKVAGQIYNIGGGPRHTLSIWLECGPMLEEFLGKKIRVDWDEPRPGDQKVYVSDIRKAKKELRWAPTIGVEEGARELFEWVKANGDLFD